MKNLFNLSLLILVIFSSCKKNGNDPNPENISLASQYMPLKTGNYFIYQYYRTDIAGNATNGLIDTVYISKDTVINNQKFYKVKRTLKPYHNTDIFPRLLGDSSGYLLEAPGNIILSDQLNTTVRSENRYFLINSKITSIDSVITVPAGTFKTICYTSYCTEKFNGPSGNNYILYSKNIGIIIRECFYSHDPRLKVGIKLIGYHLN